MLGIYGGSFDPVHLGHLATASEAGQLTGCDRVLMVPAAISPGKEAPRVCADERLEMLRIAVAEWPGLDIEPCELHRAGPSFTVDTLRLLRQRESQPLLLIIGADAFLGLEKWRHWRELFQLAHLFVAARPDVEWRLSPKLAAEYEQRLVEEPAELAIADQGLIMHQALRQYPLSSTRIRQQLSLGHPVEGVPEKVLAYIRKQRLYRDR